TEAWALMRHLVKPPLVVSTLRHCWQADGGREVGGHGVPGEERGRPDAALHRGRRPDSPTRAGHAGVRASAATSLWRWTGPGKAPTASALPDGGPNQDAPAKLGADEVKDFWTYHALADVIRGVLLLASQPDIDPERLGIAGISWGDSPRA